MFYYFGTVLLKCIQFVVMNNDALKIFFLVMIHRLHSLSSQPETELNLDHCNKSRVLTAGLSEDSLNSFA